MKVISVFVMFVLLGIYADAQDAKVVAEIASRSESTVKNAPFSADAVSESVQTLADGNRIVRSSTSKLYRNSEGRFRREMTGGSGGGGFAFTYGQGVTVLDPVGGFRYMLDPNMKTARQVVVRPNSDVRIVTGAMAPAIVSGTVGPERVKAAVEAAVASGGGQTIVTDRARDEIRVATTVGPIIEGRAMPAPMPMSVGEGFSTYAFGTGQSKWETRSEQLGTQNIEGVDAEGTRTITTIPAGAIGNERPIEITYERWYSKELQLVVMSKHNDPRYGEQTYRLTNIVRSEPDPSLFTVPNGYRLITEPRGQYEITTAAKAAQAEKAVKAQTISVTNKKP